MNTGHIDLLLYVIITHWFVVNNCYTKCRCAQKSTNVLSKTRKGAYYLHLMTPSSANIGHSDLLFTVQIDVHQGRHCQHALLVYGE